MDHSLLPNILQFISRLDPFDKLSDKLLDDISRYMTISYLAKGEGIPPEQLSQGYLYIIRTGAIEQFELNGDFRARLDQGDVFGFTMVIDRSVQKFQARALENTLLYMLPSNRFKELNQDPIFAAHFAIHFRSRLKSALQYSLAPDDALLLQNVKQFCNQQIIRVGSGCSIQNVAKQMADRRATSALIVDNEKMVGFITDRNLTKRVVAAGKDIKLSVSEVMSVDPPTIQESDMVLHAVSAMMRHSIRNLPVMSGQHVVGVVNVSDLVQKHTAQAVYLIDAIRRQGSVEKIAELMPQRQLVFDALVDSEIRPHLVSQVMTIITDALTVRLIELAEEKLIESGIGKPSCAFAWMVAGSQARHEMQMVSDQDNAIVLSDDATDDDRIYFNKLAELVCRGLAECGYEFCPGEMMATNSKWCQSLKNWKNDYLDWITHPQQEALLNVSVFMDIRCVHGQAGLVKHLQGYIAGLVQGNRRFINALMANMLRKSPPIGFFRTFVLIKHGKNKNSLNIKNRAVNPVVDLARIYGLLAGCEVANTHQRLQMARREKLLSHTSFEDLIGAYNFICSVRLRYQLKALRNGESISNHLPPKSLSQFERNHLKEAFWIITAAQEVAKQQFLGQGGLH